MACLDWSGLDSDGDGMLSDADDAVSIAGEETVLDIDWLAGGGTLRLNDVTDLLVEADFVFG